VSLAASRMCKVFTRPLASLTRFFVTDARERPPFDLDFKLATTILAVTPHPTPSFFCRLVEDVVYWNSSFLSG
jgi:hypothetical protein